MNRYTYDGPVSSFGKVVDSNWHGETIAASEKKALTNLSYQFKKKLGYIANSRFELDPKYLKQEEEYGD